MKLAFLLSTVQNLNYLNYMMNTSALKKTIQSKKTKKKKDNTKNGDYLLNCRACNTYIKGDWRSSRDTRYCRDCLD
jgi:formamidopyrimidine-DNA glycosylase